MIEPFSLDDGQEEVTITPGLPVIGTDGTTYELLKDIKVDPATDSFGSTISVRVTSVTSTNASWTWDGNDSQNPTLTPEAGKSATYTITYQAYTSKEENGAQVETIVGQLAYPFVVRSTRDVGERLDGDYAYISNAGMVEDTSTDSGYVIRTGTSPWDGDDTNGNDSTDLNNTVRSFDVVTYTVFFQNAVRDTAPYVTYKTGTVHFEFVLPGTSDQVQFEEGSMGWLQAKKEIEYKITTVGDKQVLRGSFLWEPSEQNPSAIGNGYQELSLAIRVLAMKQGDTVQPKFTFWMDGNQVPDSGLVTGSTDTCGTHNEVEYKTVEAPKVTVTTAPRYNVQIKVPDTSWAYTDTFDFSSGSESAPNRSAGEVTGRCGAFGVTLQIQGKDASHGLRGCEIPNGDITFDLKLSSLYRANNGTTYNVTENYTPLLWSMEGQNSKGQADERAITGILKYAVSAAPGNTGSSFDKCYNGGTWSCSVDANNTMHVTVSGYQVNLQKLPYTDLGNGDKSYVYYQKTVTNYWEIQNACFSAGEFWVVQPFYNNKTGKIVYEDDSAEFNGYTGTFNVTLSDSNLRMTGVSGQALAEVSDTSNQMTNDTTEKKDDSQTASMYLERPGSLSYQVGYAKYKKTFFDSDPLTDGCSGNDQDWTMPGTRMAIGLRFSHTNADGMNQGVAFDELLKFDDEFFEPDGTFQTGNLYYNNSPTAVNNGEGTVTFLFGAKTDKTGWTNDKEMKEATADNLIFFSSIADLKKAGYTCVAVLMECRGLYSSQRTQVRASINGTCKSTAESGKVYMITVSAKGWNKQNVQDAVVAYLKENGNENAGAASLTDADYSSYILSSAFPSRADKTDAPLEYSSAYPEAFSNYEYGKVDGLTNFAKAQYNESGYVKGESTSSSHFGDSCLVVGYTTKISKTTAQTSKNVAKTAYDMDTSQRVADYRLDPYAERGDGATAAGGEGSVTTTVYVEDTLPKGLTYIPGSSYLGGTYVQNGEGKQGTIQGGTAMEPDVDKNDDGTTILKWTLENVTVTAEKTTHFPSIYYSCEIGQAGDEENDVKNGDSLENTAKIWSTNETLRPFTLANGNYTEDSILVSKNNAVSLSKAAESTMVDAGDTISFTMNIGNNAQNSVAIIGLESLPYAGDAAGSSFKGECLVTGLTITNLQAEFGGSNFKLYYTTSKDERGKRSDAYEVGGDTSPFSDTAIWTELTVNASDGTVTLPKDFKPVAIAAVGTLPAKQTLKMKITLFLPSGQPGDYIANRLSRGDMETYARSYIVSRILEGCVWLDADNDGLRSSSETVKDGVKATLLKLKEGGDATKAEDYEEYKVNDKTATVQTGKQLNLSTWAETDYTTGRYKFSNLPAGTFGVRFSDGTFSILDYSGSPVDQGSNDAIDSDATPSSDTDGGLTSAVITGIVMPTKEKIATSVYSSRNHDLGLYGVTRDLTVTKTWRDANDQDGKRPEEITVNLLYSDDTSAGQTLTLTAEEDWRGKFTGLPTRKDGKAVSYKVSEEALTGYTASISGSETDGYTITNTHTAETITVTGSKTWEDGNDQDGLRPDSIKVSLYANGEKKDTKTVTAANNWSWSFADLPRYSSGSEIKYEVQEEAVTGYTATVDGYDITNTHTPATIDISVTKAWNDADDQDGLRPNSVTVKLLADGSDTGNRLELKASENWTGSFTGLDQYKNGTEIQYTVEETAVSGYTAAVTGSMTDGFTITNSHTPESIEISGSKTWDDANNQDGKRPSSLTVRLLADGTVIKSSIVTEKDGWGWSFTELPKYRDHGTEIV